nr:classical arabinogalactan protein 9-like [Penaeus vannamei]
MFDLVTVRAFRASEPPTVRPRGPFRIPVSPRSHTRPVPSEDKPPRAPAHPAKAPPLHPTPRASRPTSCGTDSSATPPLATPSVKSRANVNSRVLRQGQIPTGNCSTTLHVSKGPRSGHRLPEMASCGDGDERPTPPMPRDR